MADFDHTALKLDANQQIVFTALSKKYFYMRFLITRYVLEQGHVPLNPFTSFDYFMLDTVDRDIVRRANNRLVKAADELWVFGDVSDGVLAEILQARERKQPIQFFKITDDKTFSACKLAELDFEPDVVKEKPALVALLEN